MMTSGLTLLSLFMFATVIHAKKLHYVHWNRANPLFRNAQVDPVVDVNFGNEPWEYDQVNLICPVSKPGLRYPEKHVVYSVSREEFESCRITNPKPKIVAICNQPHRLMYFTITFRSFTPTPGGLEFKPGHDYYFISTASSTDLHRRVGGGCSTHHMKMIFRVADNRKNMQDERIFDQPRMHLTHQPKAPVSSVVPASSSTTERSLGSSLKDEFLYYYHPRDLVAIDNNGLEDDNQQRYDVDIDLWKKQALRFTSSSSSSPIWSSASGSLICLLMAAIVLMH